jgi:ferredoxin
MTRIEIDRGRCIGAGLCAAGAPTHFAQASEDGLSVVALHPRDAAERAAVERAVAACPVQAIRVIEAP